MKTRIFFLGVLLGTLGCSDEGEESICSPGEQGVCFCQDGSSGVNFCNEDGKGWGYCDCTPITDTGTVLSQDTGTGVSQDTGTGVSQDTGTGLGQDTGTGLGQDTGTGLGQDTGTGPANETDSDIGDGGDLDTETATGDAPDGGPDTEIVDTGIDTGADPCAECMRMDGADLLVIVDNSSSMLQEQEILATGFYTLINSLVNPTEDWEYDAANDVRVGVVSTDIGLQWGEDGEMGEERPGCEDEGDNAAFMTAMPEEITVESHQIKCDVGSNQCPDGWDCTGGTCVAPGGAESGQVPCTPLGGDPWTEHIPDATNLDLVKQVSCLAQLGNEGCGIEQQLQAGIKALERSDQVGFVRDNYLLATIVVSDEEDCSIRDNGLFATDEWQDPEHRGTINTACNYPAENEENFLFPPQYFYDKLVGLKGGVRSAVVFAAIVGVPSGAGSPCQGRGDEISGCLDDASMQFNIQEYQIGEDTIEHFVPACTREVGGELVTEARPGRRFVQLAQEFGCAGYVYSICNEDWSQAMSEIARMIVKCIDLF